MASISMSSLPAKAFDSVNSNSGDSAPILNPVIDFKVNPLSVQPSYTPRNGILIAELLDYIEKLHQGHQFFTTSSDFLLNKSQFGVAITEIKAPAHVDALITIGGNNFLYALVNSPHAGLARMLEPHQKLSFRSYSTDSSKETFEVKVKFRLWDLREREQLSSFSWYRIDKVGGTSPFSLGEQEVTFTVTPLPPANERPFWSKDKNLKNIRINLKNSDVFQMSVKDMLTGSDGEVVLRDKSNRPLGLKFLNWNSPIGSFYYRYDVFAPWVELIGEQTYFYLGMDTEVKIDFDETEIRKHNSLQVKGWDGQHAHRRNHVTTNNKTIQFIFENQ
jgi:hypothetical protein